MTIKRPSSTLPRRAARYARVGAQAAKLGAGVAASRLRGGDMGREAALLRGALGSLKGPLMKVGQLLAAIPDFLPREVAAELATLQADAPPMGWPFVRRRMAAELGPNWQDQFDEFDKKAFAAASLGQVHKARAQDGTSLACKLQYPGMDSVVEADVRQLKLILNLFETFGGAVSTQDAFEEIAERLREELDYAREARNIALYAAMLAEIPAAHVPRVFPDLSTPRLLTMSYLSGEKIEDVIRTRGQGDRNQIAINMFHLWYAPFYHYGVIHGDPHPGNCTFSVDGSVNLLDFGCIRVFEPQTVQAVVELYQALRDNKPDQAANAYRLWGFETLTKETMETLNIWARFVYAPLLDDRARPLDETNATAQGRQAAQQVYRALKHQGTLSIPRPFVMIDRASIGLGGLFLRLGANLNWHRLFHETVGTFDLEALRQRQKNALSTTH